MGKRQTLLAVAFVTMLTACLTLTNETFKEVQAKNVVAIFGGVPCVEKMELNPLKTGEHVEIDALIKAHYQEVSETQDFVENYQNITVFTKRAKYKDTYVVFAKYEMKIKDIYSAVPGLETFYVNKDPRNEKYQIEVGKLDDRTKQVIRTVSAHSDVITLFEQTEKEYEETIQSDALLREALADLQNACEDSDD